MIRITIEVNDKEVSSTAIQPTSTASVRPTELLTGAAAVDALDAGSAPNDMAARASTETNAGASRENTDCNAVESTSTLGIPSPELLIRAAAVGALDAGGAPSDMADLAGASRERGSSTEYVEEPKDRKEQ